MAPNHVATDWRFCVCFCLLLSVHRMNSTDREYGMRVCVGGSSSLLDSGPAFGGIAFLNSFDYLARSQAEPYFQPAFVFPECVLEGASMGGTADGQLCFWVAR
jgi:hypothetical protein